MHNSILLLPLFLLLITFTTASSSYDSFTATDSGDSTSDDDDSYSDDSYSDDGYTISDDSDDYSYDGYTTTDDGDDYINDDSVSNQELCECFDIEFFLTNIPATNTICYFYRFIVASTESYCSQLLNYIALETNQDDCGVTIDDILISSEPNTIDTNFYGTFVDGIQVTLNTQIGDNSSYYSSGSSSDPHSSDSSDSYSFSSDSSNSLSDSYGFDATIFLSDSSESSSFDGGDPIVFSLCFDASIVGGTQHTAPIEIQLGDHIFTCDLRNMLPDLCGNLLEPTCSPTHGPTMDTVPPTPGPTLPPTLDTDSPSSAPTLATAAPSLSPSIAPVYSVCATNDAWNIAWLLDESGSVAEPDWLNSLEFVDRIMQYDVPPDSSSTLFEFASYPGFEQFLDWNMVEDASGSRDVWTDALLNNAYNKGGLTYTWDAVNRVLDEFWDYRFSCTDGCETRQDVLILMTDGRPTDQVCPNITNRVNQSDVDIIVIGVGMTKKETQSIKCLDVKDGGADVINVDSYDDIDLRSLELEVRDRLCDGQNPPVTGNRPADGTEWVYEDGSIGLGPIPTVDPDGGGGGPGDT
eukprot:212566_1